MAKSGDRSVASTAGYRAHHMIALCFMLFASTVGTSLWFSSTTGWLESAAGRFAVTSADSEVVRFLAAVLLGELLLWDLPTALWVKRLRRPDMLLHHVAMALVAALVAYCPIFYGLFYLGVVEISTVPLIANEYFAVAYEANAQSSATHQRHKQRQAWLSRCRDTSQIAAALTFVIVRGYLFTRVTLNFVAEALGMLATTSLQVGRWPIQLMIGFTIGFNLLQLAWLRLLIKYTLNQGLGGERPA